MTAKFDEWNKCSVDEIKNDYDANKAMLESFMIGTDFRMNLDHFENLDSLKKALLELTKKVQNAINEEFQFKRNAPGLAEQKPPLYKRAYGKVKKLVTRG